MNLLSVSYALLSALGFGVGDFIGGAATRRLPARTVVLASQLFGLTALIIIGLISQEVLPTARDILFGALGGIIGQLGLVMLYQGIAVGQVGIVSPVAAVVSAVLPVIYTGFTVGRPPDVVLIGFVLALVGVWLVSASRTQSDKPTGLRLAVLAGIGFSGFFVLIAQTAPGSVYFPLVAARLSSIALFLATGLIRRDLQLPSTNALPLIAAAGLADVAGNVFFVLAKQAGRLDIATIISSMYPAITVLLALIFFRERLSRPQWIGAALLIAALPLIAAR